MARHEIMKRNLSDEEEFKPRNNSKLSEDQSSDDDVYNDDGNDGICDDDDHDDDSEYEGEKYESQSKPKVSMAVKVGNTSKDDSKEEEYGNEDKQVEHPPSAALSKSRSKAFGRRFPFVFGKRHSRPNTKKKLLARIEELENQQAVAQSKMAQMELEMSNETKAVIKERDGLQADLTNLRLLYEDSKTQLENVELELERAKEKENAKSAFEMKRPRARWLWKRGVHGPTGRIWRHRWFKAENDGRLYYYKKKTIQRGFIEIDKITEVQDLPSSKQNKENSCFNIVTPDRTYEMKAEDEDEKIRNFGDEAEFNLSEQNRSDDIEDDDIYEDDFEDDDDDDDDDDGNDDDDREISVPGGDARAQAVYEKVLSEISDLKSETAVAQSKMIEAVTQERERLQTEITQLQIKLGKAEVELENVKKLNQVRGWLWKRGVLGPTAKIWRRRWFMAQSDGRLYYYHPRDKIIPKGFIQIDAITEVQDLSSSRQNEDNSRFNVITPTRTYELKAKDKDDKLRWICDLNHLTSCWPNVQASANEGQASWSENRL